MMMSNETNGRRRAIRIEALPKRSEKMSSVSSARLPPASFSTAGRTKALESPKQRAAPGMADDQDRVAPQTQPNSRPLVKVRRKVGIGAAIDCNTMSAAETTGAQMPNPTR